MEAKLIRTEVDDNQMAVSRDILLTLTDAEYKVLMNICEEEHIPLTACIGSALVNYKRLHNSIWSDDDE